MLETPRVHTTEARARRVCVCGLYSHRLAERVDPLLKLRHLPTKHRIHRSATFPQQSAQNWAGPAAASPAARGLKRRGGGGRADSAERVHRQRASAAGGCRELRTAETRGWNLVLTARGVPGAFMLAPVATIATATTRRAREAARSLETQGRTFSFAAPGSRASKNLRKRDTQAPLLPCNSQATLLRCTPPPRSPASPSSSPQQPRSSARPSRLPAGARVWLPRAARARSAST